jgi:hypothetical protein
VSVVADDLDRRRRHPAGSRPRYGIRRARSARCR